MNDQVNYQNNPLHGISLKNLLIEIIDHYSFEILYAYLNINCFKTKPSIESSVKFLKKPTGRGKKSKPFICISLKAPGKQFFLPPRDRIIPVNQTPGEPAILSVPVTTSGHPIIRPNRQKPPAESAEKTGTAGKADPWAKARNSTD